MLTTHRQDLINPSILIILSSSSAVIRMCPCTSFLGFRYNRITSIHIQNNTLFSLVGFSTHTDCCRIWLVHGFQLFQWHSFVSGIPLGLCATFLLFHAHSDFYNSFIGGDFFFSIVENNKTMMVGWFVWFNYCLFRNATMGFLSPGVNHSMECKQP